MNQHRIFIAGGTGYMGTRLIAMLLQRGHEVCALARQGSAQKLPPGCAPIIGNALDKNSYAEHSRLADTFVHLVGVSHPNPSKAKQFRNIDLASVQNSVPAAVAAGIKHFVYVSVAHPAPIMQAYWQVRAECEELIRASGLNATILRPWYVLGPGHWWPYVLTPMYWLFERLPSTRDTARRLGQVTLKQMLYALTGAIENPSQGIRVLEVEQIRRANLNNGKMNK
ncbi:NAD(P)H-binding protein [candidate division KSB1 bacterium]|nr:NAD(P)H-binding protein [candidate division KSB1 bacterium]